MSERQKGFPTPLQTYRLCASFSLVWVSEWVNVRKSEGFSQILFKHTVYCAYFCLVWVSEWVKEWVNVRKAEGFSQVLFKRTLYSDYFCQVWVSKWVNEWVNVRKILTILTDWIDEIMTASERVSDGMSERVSEWMTEWASEWVNKWGEWVSEQWGKRAGEWVLHHCLRKLAAAEGRKNERFNQTNFTLQRKAVGIRWLNRNFE